MSFKPGDLVWAKMKGFSPWPGEITVPNSKFQSTRLLSNFYCVYFFGTKNYGMVGANNIKPYHEHREKMMKLNQTAALKNAIKEIEEYIHENLKKSTDIPDRSEDTKEINIKANGKIEAQDEVTSEFKLSISNEIVPKNSPGLQDLGNDTKEFDGYVEVKIENLDGTTFDFEESFSTEAVPKHMSPTVKLDQLLVCGQCNQCFPRAKDYQRHLLTHKQNAESPTKYSSLNGKYVFGETKDNNTRTNKTCNKCNKTFKYKSHYIKHMKAHAGIRDLLCRYCNKAFTYKNSLVEHERRHTGERPYDCTKCEKSFVSCGDLTKHLTVHRNVIFNCGKCKRSFKNKKCFNNHMRRHNRPTTLVKKHRCETCSKVYHRRDHLENHISRDHTHIKDHECPYCGKAFSMRQYMTLNTRKMHESQNYECDYCKKVFPYKQYISKHTAALHLEKLYCNVCMKAFISSEELEKHKTQPCARKKFSCKICYRELYNAQHLKRHMMAAHADEALNKCSGCAACGGNPMSKRMECFVKLNRVICCRRPGCSKYFWKNEDYAAHLLIHKNNPVRARKRQQTQTPKKKLVSARHMKYHLRVHDGNYPYSCYKCGKGFCYPRSLEEHMKVHAGIKDFHCSYCSKAFSTRGSCKSHELTHVAERPYKCPLCIRTFAAVSHRLSHTLAAHTNATFKCASCKEVFGSKRELTRHVWHYHGKKCVLKVRN